MPKLKYRPSRDIPEAVRILETTSPSDISDWILSKFNVKRTPESITMWFKRNHDVLKRLEAEIAKIGVVTEEEVVKESTFEKGVFEELDSVKNWIRIIRRKETVKESTLRSMINSLKRFCKGVYPRIDKNTQMSYFLFKKKGYIKEDFESIDLKEHGWSYKHPDRITIEDVYEFLDLMKEYYSNVDTSEIRMPLRSFLKSKGIDVEDKISGKKHKSAGIYARLFVPLDIIFKILDYIVYINYEAYVADNFMFNTGTRVTATLESKLENIYKVGDWILKDEYRGDANHIVEEKIIDDKWYVKVENYFITVFDKGASSIYGEEGHPWEKFLKPELFEEIKIITDYPVKISGNIFNISVEDLTELNREAYNAVYPKLLEKYPLLDVNHFWRHMFAQHYLRLTGWNYGVVANMGGWDTKSLEESYGKPPIEEIRKWGVKFITQLTRG